MFKGILNIFLTDLYFEQIYIYIQFSGDGKGGVTGTYEIKNRGLRSLITVPPLVTMAFLMWFNHNKIPYLHFLLALCYNHT